MLKKLLLVGFKIICTLVLVYSVIMILMISTFDLLTMSVHLSFTLFLIERIIPNASAVIALIFLIIHIWKENTDKPIVIE